MSIDQPSPDSKDAAYYSDVTYETPIEKVKSAQEMAAQTQRAAIAPKSLKPDAIKENRGLAADGRFFI